MIDKGPLMWRKASRRRFELGYEYGSISDKRQFYTKGAVEMVRSDVTTWRGIVERRRRMRAAGGGHFMAVIRPTIQTFPTKAEALAWVQALVVLGEDE